MAKFSFVAAVVLLCVSCVPAAELPKQGMQVINASDDRKAVVLDQGDVLQILLPNGSGNFAEDLTVEVGKSPLKLTRTLAVRYRNDEGQDAIGGGEIALFFDALRPGTGDLTITVKRMFDRGEKPVKLRVTVKPATTAAGQVDR